MCETLINQPLVSVNITTFNRPALLQRALSSVASQHYKKLEVVIADDCSSENLESIIDVFRPRLNIKYVKHSKNMGNAAARNTALSLSTGDFVAFLDDDDEWVDPYKITNQVSLLSSLQRETILCSNVVVIDSKSGETVKTLEMPKNLTSHLLAGNGLIFNSSVMLKRSTMIKVGGFDELMKKGVDSEFFRRCVVGFDVDVIIAKDVTTAVHEHGETRMTPVRSLTDIDRALSANLRLVMKYRWAYVKYPFSLSKRMLIILRLAYKRIFKRFERP